MFENEMKNLVKMNKVIAIIESCVTTDQFQVAKDMIDNIEFETIGDCKKIKEVLIKKENELNTNPCQKK